MRFVWMLLGVALLWVPRPAWAHALRTAYVAMTETETGIVTIRADGEPVLHPSSPVDIEGCQREGDGEFGLVHLRCDRELDGQVIRFGFAASDVHLVLDLTTRAGHHHTGIVSASQPTYRVPFRGVAPKLLIDYAKLGASHVLFGLDHLLFVLGLLWLSKTVRRVLVTTTAFTAAHSVTLAAATLGYCQVSSRAAEACIALSLVFVGLELASRDVVGTRRLAGYAATFGLVHGLGFAGGLLEMGLPRNAVGVALLSFNVGVEMAQLAFVFVVLLALNMFLRRDGIPRARHACSYVVGSVGVMLLLSRLEGVLDPVFSVLSKVVG